MQKSIFSHLVFFFWSFAPLKNEMQNFNQDSIRTIKARSFIFGPQCEKTCLQGFVNNKGIDQTVQTHSLVSAFVIRLLERIIPRLARSELSIF